MNKKALIIAAVALLAVIVIPGCAMFKAAQEPVKECLNAWKKGDYVKAYSYFSEQMQAGYSFETFKEYVQAYPVKKFSLKNTSISADGTGYVQGTVNIKGGDKLGCKFEIVEISDDNWKVVRLHAFSKDLIP